MRKPGLLPAGLALALAGCQSVPIAEQDLVAVGAEPFWSVEVSPAELTYATPANLLGISVPAVRKADPAGITWTAQLAGQPFILRVEPGACRDGMSDTRYPYTAILTLGGNVRRGCAHNGPERDR